MDTKDEKALYGAENEYFKKKAISCGRNCYKMVVFGRKSLKIEGK